MKDFVSGDIVVIVQKIEKGYRVIPATIINSIIFERAQAKRYYVHWFEQKETGHQWVNPNYIFKNWKIAQTVCNKLNEEMVLK